MIIAFDIDSTLADISHRLPFITGKKKNWPAFFNSCDADLPILSMVGVYQSLEPSNIIYLLTGRPEHTRTATENWLAEHSIKYMGLLMRRPNDYRADYIVKREMVDGLIQDHGRIDLAVDDSPEVVKMYRSLGIFTLDANQGGR